MLKKSVYSVMVVWFWVFIGLAQEKDPLNLTALMASPNTVYEVRYKDGDGIRKTLCYLRASFKPDHILLYIFDTASDSYKNIEVPKSAIYSVKASGESIGRHAEEQKKQSPFTAKKLIIGGVIACALIGGIAAVLLLPK